MQTISSNYHKPVKAIFALTVLFLFQATGIKLRAQETESLPWQQRDRQEMKPIEYEYVREADVMWSKNIWRVIDTRQKMNLPFSYPERPLIQVIHEAAKKGDITVYDASVLNADRFVKVLPLAEVQKMGEKNDTMMIIDVENPEIG